VEVRKRWAEIMQVVEGGMAFDLLLVFDFVPLFGRCMCRVLYNRR
jgi:hypothetical protein